MKIIAYETRQDEQAYFDKIKEDLGINVFNVCDILSEENVHLTRNVYGISVLGHSKIDIHMIDALAANGVKHISSRTIGLNHIDLAYARKKGLIVTNSSYQPDGVAEYTIMMMLMSLRKYKQAMFRGNVNDYSLTGLSGREIKHCTVGVVGTGSIGTAVIYLLQAFGCKVLACSPTLGRKPELEPYAQFVDLETLYRESDIITLHIPLAENTRHIINEESFKIMKDGVVIINCSRGELIEINALIDNIENSKISSLALDVFEDESEIYHHDRRLDIIANRNMAYLRQFPNVVMTQHLAFYTENATKNMVTGSLSSFVKEIEQHQLLVRIEC